MSKAEEMLRAMWGGNKMYDAEIDLSYLIYLIKAR